jgi:hypothetical protein
LIPPFSGLFCTLRQRDASDEQDLAGKADWRGARLSRWKQ